MFNLNPIWARRGQHLYRVLVEGSNVKVPVVQSEDFIRGFFSTRIVAAMSSEQATSLAFEAVMNEWRNSTLVATEAASQPTLAAPEVTQLRKRMLFRSPRGFTFYTQLG